MIKTTLKEYKELRNMVEEYYKLLNNYNILVMKYNELAGEEIKEDTPKTKKIGFGNE